MLDEVGDVRGVQWFNKRLDQRDVAGGGGEITGGAQAEGNEVGAAGVLDVGEVAAEVITDRVPCKGTFIG